MGFINSAIVFVNADLTGQVKSVLVRQLFITEVMDGYEFDARVLSDPNYPIIIRANNLKILVIRPFYEHTNRELADVAIFVKAGMATVEYSKYGPPGLTLPVARIYLNELIKKKI